MALYFHPDYSAPRLRRDAAIPYLQLQRAERALARLARERLVRRRDIIEPPLAAMQDLQRAHTASYLERVSDPGVLGPIFGVEPHSIDEPDVLIEAQRRAVGGTLMAARFAALAPARVGVNLGGGFHHAAPDGGAGFCIFNDVAVALRALRADGFDAPVAIIDLDFHQGDGNLLAFANDPSVFVYSVHGSTWTEHACAACRNESLPSGVGDDVYLARVREGVQAVLASHPARLIFYIAGVDVLGGDLLGDFQLTHAGVLARDKMVIEAARSSGASVVVTLAGGYSAGAWQCTANLLRWLLCDSERVDEESDEVLRRRFASTARHIDPFELQRDGAPDVHFDADEILRDLAPRPPRRLLLDYYSPHGVEFALERYGVLAQLRERGFSDLRLEVRPDDPSRQVLRVRGSKHAGEPVLLVELVLSRRSTKLPLTDGGDERIEVLYVEWLLLQDPTRPFSRERPQLPGQEHPGLGLAQHVQELLTIVCERLGLEAIAHRPAHYHNAVWAARRFRFADPALEGRFRAMRRALANYRVGVASAWVDAGRLRLGDGSPVPWEPGEYLLPVSARVRDYFANERYSRAVQQAYEYLLAQGLHVEAPTRTA